MKNTISLFFFLSLFFNFIQAQDNCLNFDTSKKNHVSISNNSLLQFNCQTGTYTLEAWIKPTTLVNMGGIISKYNSATKDYNLRLRVISSADCKIQFNGITNTSTGLIQAGKWYHIVAVVENGVHKLYVNGKQEALSSTTVSFSGMTSTALEIGGDYVTSLTSGYFFDGNIDDVAVWSKALTLSDAQNHMNNGINTETETGLVAYYRLNQGTPGGTNTSITTATTAVNTPTLNGSLKNFTLTGTTSNWIDSNVKEGTHPRLLLFRGETALIRQSIQDALLKKVHDAMINRCNSLLTTPVKGRYDSGSDFLTVAREIVARIYQLAYGYRMTNDDRYLNRARKEMINAAGFPDWNPTHFLDVAEMTSAMAIGYDWLYNKLPTTTRDSVKTAIINLGLDPSFVTAYNQNFINQDHNWNQVCHSGMVFGAIALDGEYSNSQTVVNRAINDVSTHSMLSYNPSGAYPEGYGYWHYGTTFNVMMIEAYERYYNMSFDFTDTPGFLNTGDFMLYMQAPTGKIFNYSDSEDTSYLQPAIFWFANKMNKPELLWHDKNRLAATTNVSQLTAGQNPRILPVLLTFYRGKTIGTLTAPNRSVCWVSGGANPISIFRTSWSDANSDAMYLTLKAGSPSVNHAHMDMGSFILEAGGYRWASDLGLQNYNTYDGINKWLVFRNNLASHNTLTVNNDTSLLTSPTASIVSTSSSTSNFRNAVADLLPVYSEQLTAYKRGAALVNDTYAVIRDEFTTKVSSTNVKWKMLTNGVPTITDASTITLTQGTKTLKLKFNSTRAFTLKIWNSATPRNTWDVANPNTYLVGWEMSVPTAGTSVNCNAFLVLQENFGSINTNVPSLVNWNNPWSGVKRYDYNPVPESAETIVTNFSKNENILTIKENKSVAEVRIYDLSGHLIYKKQNPETTIKLPYLNKGMYLVNLLQNDGKVVTSKFLN